MPRASHSTKKEDLEGTLCLLLGQALRELHLVPADSEVTPSLEIPKTRTHGDLSSPIALQCASQSGRPALEIAQSLVEGLRLLLQKSPIGPSIERVDVKPPGFVNFFLSNFHLEKVLQEVLEQDFLYGRTPLGEGRKALVEFVSANPTGPLSVAHGRQAAVGDALANILEFAGYLVTREYYLNDEGTQIDLLGQSILSRAKEQLGLPAEFPENGYKGSYVIDAGKKLIALSGKRSLEGRGAQERARRFGVKELTGVIQEELEQFGVHFDRWYPQSRLDRLGFLRRTLSLLKRKGYLYESEGAWWLKSTAFGDDKDRVVIRSDGRLTYIAADIAYHRRKFQQGHRLLVNLWGPDHHGYIPRLKAAVAALGFDPKILQIRIVQLCTLKRGAETIPMSTREGQFITLTQVMKEVGVDAARFFFLLRKMDAQLEFDLELAKKQSPENPVYYIQYAHARISSIQKNQPAAVSSDSASTAKLLVAAEEVLLLKLLREFPGAVAVCAQSLEPFGLVSYAQELAEAFHRFYDRHRVVGVDPPLMRARMQLVQAVKTVLATSLKLLGVSAPEKM